MGQQPTPVEGGREHPNFAFRVQLTLVASINPEYGATVPLFEWTDAHLNYRVLQRHIEGEQSRDNSVSTALMVRSISFRVARS
jgi:hypothetical protein